MEQLSLGHFKTTLKFLRTAEKLVSLVDGPSRIHKDDRCKLIALTLNNLGCYYKRANKPNVALRYMKSALKSEERSGQPKSHIASTKLNICAILSLLHKHSEAIKFVDSAIYDLTDTLRLIKIQLIPNPHKKMKVLAQYNISAKLLDSVSEMTSKQSRSSLEQTLGVAYYNLAVEHEYCKEYEEAMEAFRRSMQCV